MSAFPPTWAIQALGDVVDVLDSRRVPVSAKERSNRAGDVPYYGATGKVGSIDKSLFNEPLVLLGEDGVQFFDPDKPKSYLIEGPAWVNNHAHVLRPRDGLDRRFLNYYLNTVNYRGFANGTTRLKLTQAAMRRIPVPLLPVDEQYRIVDLLEDHLSRLDAADAGIRRSRGQLQSLHGSTLETVIAAARHDSSTVVATVGDLATVTTGVTPLRSNPAFYAGGCVPWITSGDLKQGTITSANQFVTEQALADTSLKLVPAGAILVAMYGEGKTRGTSAFLDIDAATNQACAAIQLHDSSLRNWVKVILDTKYDAMRRMAAGGVQPNLNLGLLRSVEIPIPSQKVQQAALQRLETTADATVRLRSALDHAEKRSQMLRRHLLAAAFSGQLTRETRDLNRAWEASG